MLAAPAGAAAAAVVLALSREAQELHLRHLQKRLPRAREEEGRVRGACGPREAETVAVSVAPSVAVSVARAASTASCPA